MDTAISATTLRIIIAVIGVVILLAIYFFGRPRLPEHGRRLPFRRRSDVRVEPVLGDAGVPDGTNPDAGVPHQGELDVASGDEQGEGDDAADPAIGQRAPDIAVDTIVTLYVVAHEGEIFHGSDIVVAAEKAGLRFGAMHIFHRLVDARSDAMPVFSMANMVKPGNFDMGGIAELTTPGVTFFITLPGPLPALDAWEAMLPTAQRIAELLDGELLDEDRNTLGRQRIAGLREELRAWDRRHTGEEIQPAMRR